MIKNNSDVVFAKSGNRIHPTIGLWKNNIKELELDINEGVRKIDAFTNFKVSYEEWDIKRYDPFLINNREDLNIAKVIMIKIRGRGGTGIRATLRSLWRQLLGGSNPLDRTNYQGKICIINYLYLC